ncbi:MAG: hypothetical protein ACYCVD_16835 [Desulfitobacteriaceae bacterium]
MPKLVAHPDGSISYELDDSNPKESAKKQGIVRMKAIKGSVKGKDFKILTPADKDALLELLLKLHGLI